MSVKQMVWKGVLFVVVLTVVLAQVAAYAGSSTEDFDIAIMAWGMCNLDVTTCQQSCVQNPDPPWCRTNCNFMWNDCAHYISWPEPLEMDFCQNAQYRASQCASELQTCMSVESNPDCWIPYDACLESSGIWTCQ